MPEASLYRRTLATLGFFTLTAGDLWRYLLTWWGWGAIVGILLVLGIIELVRMRIDLRRLPITLLAFLALIALSTAWSVYPGATALGVVATLVTTTFAVYLATAMDLETMLRCFGIALRWILGLSLLFELVVAVVIQRHVLPFWVDYSGLQKIPNAFYWSRDLLFHGGRIQGIVGNSNLLALVALFAVIVFGIQFAARTASRAWLGFWGAVAIVTLALTRSSTVLAALAAVVLVTLFIAIVRHFSGRKRLVVYLVGIVIAVAGIAAAIAARGPLLHLIGKRGDLTHRTEIWSIVVSYADQRPAAGWGWVSYWAPWVYPFDKPLVKIGGVEYLQAHDAWIDIYLQLGIIGLIVFAALVLVTLGRSWLAAIDASKGAGLVRLFPILILVALLVHSIAESRLLIEICFALLAIVAIRTSPGYRELIRSGDD
ncbi:MAG TPA: O-antigen ligase family protein [Pseudolysinimonas sp.]|nr:O-antigen ligase family protein [Pseudolysinimonas sp.]